jgi:hypothetical protein
MLIITSNDSNGIIIVCCSDITDCKAQVARPFIGNSRGGHIEKTIAMRREAYLGDVGRAMERGKVWGTAYCGVGVYYVWNLRVGGQA